MARIILVHKGQGLKDFVLQKGSLTVGRSNDNAVVFADPQVSSYHARIDKRGSEHILTDLQSTNGTFVNNLRVYSHRLLHGDRISIGKHTLVFIGTEAARFDSRLEKTPLDKTVIIGGTRRSRARPSGGSSPAEPAFRQPKASSFSPRVFFVLVLAAVIFGIGFWGLRDEPFFFHDILSKGKKAEHGDFRTFRIPKQEPLSTDPQPEAEKDVVDTREMESAGWAIDAIVWSSDGKSSFALINGIKVMTGDEIEGITVVDIGRDHVLLRSQDGRSTFRLTLALR